MSDMAEIQKAVDKLTDQVREKAEKAVADAARGIQMTEGIKEQVDELLLAKNEMAAELAELVQKAARRGDGIGGADRIKSAGEQFVTSEAFMKAKAEGRLLQKGQAVSVDMKQISTLDASAGQLITPNIQTGVIAIPQRRMTVRQLVAPGRTDKPAIQYFRELLFTNNAAPVAEGTRKPESNITFEDAMARVIKLAHFIKATTEVMDDVPALQSIIDQRLRYGLEFVEENQLLNGSGVGNNLNGLYTQATPFVAPIAIPGATRLDIIRLAMLQAELALLPATGTVMNPADWAAIELTKDTQGRYIIGNPQGTIGATLWGLPVVPSLAMAPDTFLTGNFRDSAQIFDREQANVVVSTENESDFVENKVTILAEERLALVVWRPQALIRGDMTPAA